MSLDVASERAALEAVESKIVLAQRDIRVLQTEIGTRGRLAQLERWNVRFIRLSAPTADQFVEGGFQLATLVKPDAKPAIEAPVVLAVGAGRARAPRSGPVPATATRPAASPRARAAAPSASDMMHVASYRAKPAAQAGDARWRSRPGRAKPAAAKAKLRRKPAKPKSAAADPLAPLPAASRVRKRRGAPAALGDRHGFAARTKDTGTPR